ncbi:hypothetical protein HAX54_029472, partial [Datura stramonium]|nr:hypothetical protein [Datura stramonium]
MMISGLSSNPNNKFNDVFRTLRVRGDTGMGYLDAPFQFDGDRRAVGGIDDDFDRVLTNESIRRDHFALLGFVIILFHGGGRPNKNGRIYCFIGDLQRCDEGCRCRLLFMAEKKKNMGERRGI